VFFKIIFKSKENLRRWESKLDTENFFPMQKRISYLLGWLGEGRGTEAHNLKLARTWGIGKFEAQCEPLSLILSEFSAKHKLPKPTVETAIKDKSAEHWQKWSWHWWEKVSFSSLIRGPHELVW
jgi:hypothetical protein